MVSSSSWNFESYTRATTWPTTVFLYSTWNQEASQLHLYLDKHYKMPRTYSTCGRCSDSPMTALQSFVKEKKKTKLIQFFIGFICVILIDFNVWWIRIARFLKLLDVFCFLFSSLTVERRYYTINFTQDIVVRSE